MIQARRRAKFRTFIFPLLLFVGALIMGVGYAAIGNVELDITGDLQANLQPGIFITDVSYYSDNEVGETKSKIKNYYGTVVNSDISLGNSSNSSVTFKLTLYNSTKSVYTFMGLNYDDYFYSNSNIKASISGINVGDKVLGKSYIDVFLTFTYADGASVDDGNLEAFLRLIFEKLPPEFSVIGNPVNWVNTDVTLEVIPSNNIPVEVYEYSFDGGSTWSTSNTKTYTENTDSVQILIRDYDGVTSATYTTKVDRIDKVAPVITLLVDIDNTFIHLWDDYVIKDFISASDDASGVNDNKYYITFNGNVVTNTTCFPNAGYYELVVHLEDNAGNYSSLNWPILVRWPTGGKYILANYSVVSNGDGLYADTAETGLNASMPFTSKYYYSGKTVNNYMTFSGNSSWQVVGIPQTNGVKIVGGDVGSYIWSASEYRPYFFDSDMDLRKNMESWGASGSLGNGGINLANYLDYVDDGVFYVGAINKSSSHSLLDEINLERTNTEYSSGYNPPAWTNKVGLLNVTEFIKMSNSSDIYSIDSWNADTYKATSWYTPTDTWTLNGRVQTLKNAYWAYSGSDEIVSRRGLDQKMGIKPVVFLKSDVIISGLGTTDCPFNVHDYDDWAWFDNAAKNGGDLNGCS